MNQHIEKDQLYRRVVDSLDGKMLEFRMNSCIATVAVGNDESGKWATIYFIQSYDQGKGHATKLLLKLKDVFKGYKFGGTVALNPTMKHLYEKTGIKEYT